MVKPSKRPSPSGEIKRRETEPIASFGARVSTVIVFGITIVRRRSSMRGR
jgi:hypothetical protein